MSQVRHFPTAASPQRPPRRSVSRLMLEVLGALLPGIVAYCWFYGWGLLIQIALAAAFAYGFEAACLALRKKPLKHNLGDHSALLCAVLYALCLPPTMPWWSSLIGMLFAIVIAKQLFGGLGHNLFNPAMVGYVAVLVAFPALAAQWPAPDGGPGLMQSLGAVLGHPSQDWDAMTQATVLDTHRQLSNQGWLVSEIRAEAETYADIRMASLWLNLAFLAGGTYLLARRLISWHAPIGLLGGLAVGSLLLIATQSDQYAGPGLHLLAGATMLGAFFIVTDPVTGSTTPRGRLLFGLGVAIITLAIRYWGGYPDGLAFGVLLMNLCVPLLDQHSKPRAYGH